MLAKKLRSCFLELALSLRGDQWAEARAEAGMVSTEGGVLGGGAGPGQACYFASGPRDSPKRCVAWPKMALKASCGRQAPVV